MSRSRAADDFATIRARIEELRRMRKRDAENPAQPAEGTAESDAEERRRARIEGLLPPWVPTIFVKNPGQ